MTPEEKKMLTEVYTFIQQMKASYSFPLELERAIQSRGFYKSFPPISHNVKYPPGFVNIFVAPTTGASPTTQLLFEDGILKQLI